MRSPVPLSAKLAAVGRVMKSRWWGLATCVSALACGSPGAPPPPSPAASGRGTGGAGGSQAAPEFPGLGGIPILGPSPSDPDFDFGADCDTSRTLGALEPALLIRDPAVLSELSLEGVLAQIIRSSGASLTPLQLLQRLFDTENTEADGVFPGVTHCDLDTPDAAGGAVECPRAEGRLARSEGLFVPGHADYFEPVAVSNRFDLLPSDASTCGEYRIVYAKHSGRTDPKDRLFISVEATLFNEAQTLATCRPVAELWAGLEARSVDEQRADVVKLFYQGVGALPPVLTAVHLGAGDSRCEYVGRCGQVRVGQGMQEPFTFRQFRLVDHASLEKTALRFEATATTRALRPALFDVADDDTLARGFRGALRVGLGDLTTSELSRVDLRTQLEDEALESAVSGPASPDFAAHLRAGTEAQQEEFLTALSTSLSTVNQDCPPDDPITAAGLVRRAAVIGCAGCHAPTQLLEDRNVGCGAVWPETLGVTHIDEQGQLSPALRDVFLPYRARVLETFLQACDGAAIRNHLHEAPSNLRPECFPAGTAITLADGSSKAIERVEPGEFVLSFDLRAGASVPARVERVVVRHDAARFVRIDDELLATDNHPFFQGGRWVRAVDLEPGKPLLSFAASQLRDVPVRTLSLEAGPRVTYNLRVAEQHSYFAGGKLVHDRP